MKNVLDINDAIKLINSAIVAAAPASNYGYFKLLHAEKYLNAQVEEYFADDQQESESAVATMRMFEACGIPVGAA